MSRDLRPKKRQDTSPDFKDPAVISYKPKSSPGAKNARGGSRTCPGFSSPLKRVGFWLPLKAIQEGSRGPYKEWVSFGLFCNSMGKGCITVRCCLIVYPQVTA